MKIKRQHSVQSIQEKRIEDISRLNETFTIQAHGKTLGQDTFSWYKPNLGEMHSFLENIPFSVILIGETHLMHELFAQYPTTESKLERVILLDEKTEIKNSIRSIALKPDLNYTIVICGESTQFKESIEEFKNYSHLL